MVPRIVRSIVCDKCSSRLIQEVQILYCTGCGWRGTLVEPFPLDADATPRPRNACLHCLRDLTDPIGCPNCSAYKPPPNKS